MAKVKSAAERITAHLKAKGLDPSEIKDVFAELDAADADLVKLADAADKNVQWNTWYQQVIPTLQTSLQDYQTLKAQMERLKAAGVNVGNADAQPDKPTPKSQSDFDANSFTKATSDLMKQMAKVGFRHMRTYNEDPDFDAIEKVMNEKRLSSVEDAYDIWEKPKREAASEKRTQDAIQKGIQEGVQDALSKQGIRAPRAKKVTDVEITPISEVVARSKDVPTPSTSELRDAFIKDMDELAGGVSH